MSHRSFSALSLLCLMTIWVPSIGCKRDTPHTQDVHVTQPRHSDIQPSPRPSRQLLLRKHFLSDHKMLLAQSPELTRGKFLKMAQSPYAYFRGSANIALRDVTSGGDMWQLPKDNNPSILLAGDPHPENFGTFLDENGELLIDLNDFDTAMTGPYLWDIHRLGVGFGMLWSMAQAQGLMEDADLVPLLNVVATTYLDELKTQRQGKTLLPTFESQKEFNVYIGAIYTDLIRRARKDGKKREALSDYTTKEDGRVVLHRGVLEPSTHDLIARDVLTDTSPELTTLIQHTRPAYLSTLLPPHRPKTIGAPLDVARRLGAGVGSYPVERLYVLYPKGLLLEYKEILKPFTPKGFTLPTHTTQAQRAVNAQRALQSTPSADVWLGHVGNATFSMKVRQRTKYQKGIKIERLLKEAKEGEWSMDDLHTFAKMSARLLAQAHMRAHGKTLQPALPKQKSSKAWLHTLTQGMQRATHQTMRDYSMFVDILNPDGSFNMSNTNTL